MDLFFLNEPFILLLTFILLFIQLTQKESFWQGKSAVVCGKETYKSCHIAFIFMVRNPQA